MTSPQRPILHSTIEPADRKRSRAGRIKELPDKIFQLSKRGGIFLIELGRGDPEHPPFPWLRNPL